MTNYSKNDKIVKTTIKSGVLLCSENSKKCGENLKGSAYLTITNKSTSTPVKFDLISYKIDEVLHQTNLFIKSLRLWLSNYALGVDYE